MSKKNPIFILGVEYQGYGVLRQMKDNNIETFLIDQDKYGLTRFSKYPNIFYQSPQYNTIDFVEFLLYIIESNNLLRPVVYPTNDEQVYTISKNRTKLEEKILFPFIKEDFLDILYDKRNSYVWAKANDITCPLSYIPNSWEDLLNCNISYPFILKPAVKDRFKFYSNKKALLIKNKQDLIKTVEYLNNILPITDIIAQEIISGDGINQYSYAGFFVNGEPIAAFSANRLRQHPPDFGRASTFVRAIKNEEIISKSENIIKKLNYTGFAEVEWKKDCKDGKFKFLEINPRLWGWHSLASKVLGNMPLLYYNYLVNNEIQKLSANYNFNWVKWITDIPVQFDLLKNGKLSLNDLKQYFNKNLISSDFDIKDIKPFLCQFILLPYLIYKRGY